MSGAVDLVPRSISPATVRAKHSEECGCRHDGADPAEVYAHVPNECHAANKSNSHLEAKWISEEHLAADARAGGKGQKHGKLESERSPARPDDHAHR
jgi:hypothetical protein